MIYEEIMYGIKCDRCHEIYEDRDGCTVSPDKYGMEEYATGDDWYEEDGRHYCPNCFIRDEDDWNKVTVKPMIHHSFFKFMDFVNKLTGCQHHLLQDETGFILRNNHCYKRLNNARLSILREIISDFVVEYKVPEKQSGKPYEQEIIRIPKNFKHAIGKHNLTSTESVEKPEPKYKFSLGQKVILHFLGGEIGTISERLPPQDGIVWNCYKVKELPHHIWRENELDPYVETTLTYDVGQRVRVINVINLALLHKIGTIEELPDDTHYDMYKVRFANEYSYLEASKLEPYTEENK